MPSWGFAEIWNKALEKDNDRPLVKREHLWASELGKAPLDVYLHMNGEVPSNLPNARARRKFEAGNVFEWIISLILKRAGILINDQLACEHQYQGLLKVTGRCDFIAGGVPDFTKAIDELTELGLPQVFLDASEEMKEYFEQNYPNGLEKKPIEIKSVSSFAFEALEARQKALSGHRLQLFHYLKSLGYKEGMLVYISRDDMRIMEFHIRLDDKELEQEYRAAIEKLSYHFQQKIEPEKEEPVIFDEEAGKFSVNLKVAYSMYLKKVYGIADQTEFDDKYRKVPTQWNRVLKRYKENKKMTALNLSVMADIAQAGFAVADVAQKFKAYNLNQPEPSEN